MGQQWDDSKPGFAGNNDIYGIGIRVGYYTQAVSLWVANFYARREAPYLHTVTLLFLLALFVGLCQLCKNPRQTHAVEPFMLTTIAYHTLYLGLWDWTPPYLLRWQVEFRKRVVVLVIWMAFHGFDTWYWWVGVWKMLPSNGPLGTVIFYPYVGNTPLFGPDEWISIAAKVLNAITISVLAFALVRLCYSSHQQRRVDDLITVERLTALTSRWLQALDEPHPEPRGNQNPEVRTAGKDAGIAISSRSDGATSTNFMRELKKADSSLGSQHDSEGPPPYRRLVRTGTGLLKMGLWRTFSSKEQVDLSRPPPDYMLYEPSFTDLNSAYDLLKATTASAQQARRRFWGIHVLRIWFFLPIWLVKSAWYLWLQIGQPFHPSVLLAITTHAKNLHFGCVTSYPVILQLTIQHPLYAHARSNDVILASRIILSTEKPVNPTRGWWLAIGYAMLGACSVLVIGTELTIQWNRILGVQDLTSVGQLIPFTLGIGSLLKIIWSAVMESDRSDEFCYFEHCAKETGKHEWADAGERFLRCREAMERRHAKAKTAADDTAAAANTSSATSLEGSAKPVDDNC